MRDFTEDPSENKDYSLFLIRHRQGLSEQLFHLIHDELSHSGLSISFERLFKGGESALVVFGPKGLLHKLSKSLDLLELEDYTNIKEDIGAWELGISHKEQQTLTGVIPILSAQEQFWWQLVLWADKKSTHSKVFHSQLRCLVVSSEGAKRKNLSQVLPNLPKDWLVKLPKAFSNEQLSDFYKKRSFQKRGQTVINYKEILQLLWI